MSTHHAGGPVGGTPGTPARPLTGFDLPAPAQTPAAQVREAEQLRRAELRKQGTPLTRIVLGVFLGLLSWSVFCAVVAGILLATVLHGIGSDSGSGLDYSPPAVGSGTLSAPCQDAITNGTDLTIPCAGDNPDLVKELSAP